MPASDALTSLIRLAGQLAPNIVVSSLLALWSSTDMRSSFVVSLTVFVAALGSVAGSISFVHKLVSSHCCSFNVRPSALLAPTASALAPARASAFAFAFATAASCRAARLLFPSALAADWFGTPEACLEDLGARDAVPASLVHCTRCLCLGGSAWALSC